MTFLGNLLTTSPGWNRFSTFQLITLKSCIRSSSRYAYRRKIWCHGVRQACGDDASRYEPCHNSSYDKLLAPIFTPLIWPEWLSRASSGAFEAKSITEDGVRRNAAKIVRDRGTWCLALTEAHPNLRRLETVP